MIARLSRPRVLIVLHQAHSTPGRVGWLLANFGFALDIRRPPLGDELPSTLAEHAGVVIFGGPMSANDETEFMKREIDWLELPLRQNTPYLGLCLGAQMLARKLGARVFNHDNGRGEIGYYPIRPLPVADTLCAEPFPRSVYHWHRDGFEVPAGAELLAEGDGFFPAQAFRYGRAFGLQFHPEVTYAMICRWTTRAAERMSAPGAQTAQAHREGWFQHDRAVGAWISAFLPEWAKADGVAAAPPAGEPSRELLIA